jgi:hypothetical protein
MIKNIVIVSVNQVFGRRQPHPCYIAKKDAAFYHKSQGAVLRNKLDAQAIVLNNDALLWGVVLIAQLTI